MKKTILIGLIAGITGLAIGYKVPKDKNAGYVMISGRITNPEQAGKYFEAVNDVVVKGCGAKTLSVDFETDVREGYDGPFSVLSKFPSKQAVIDCYEGPYQELIPLRKGAIDMNFRIVERNR
ncbi:DUF1330 domain-containing protein [Prochlorococcus sp. AH-736-L23]|nr:DUF1330 domain-containing protein [Prochlorococcus sp. AH-736-L23]